MHGLETSDTTAFDNKFQVFTHLNIVQSAIVQDLWIPFEKRKYQLLHDVVPAMLSVMVPCVNGVIKKVYLIECCFILT